MNIVINFDWYSWQLAEKWYVDEKDKGKKLRNSNNARVQPQQRNILMLIVEYYVI